MKIKAILVLTDCPRCEGRKRVAVINPAYAGETVRCLVCKGSGNATAQIPFEEFVSLLDRLVPR